MSKNNLLIVEGKDDLYSVIQLMKHYVTWPDNDKDWPVHVKQAGGIDAILREGYITAEIKASGIQRIGVMIDADDQNPTRYQSIKRLCSSEFPNCPAQMPQGGLVTDRHDGKRFGLWIMPDNQSNGTLETFLRYLIPDGGSDLWTLACDSLDSALEIGATCRAVHRSKAELHTWLAWQDPPGLPLGLALTSRILDPGAEYSQEFVSWFCRLFELRAGDAM